MLLAVHFSDSITLGAALITAAIGVFVLVRIALGVGLRTTNEIQRRRIEALEGDVTDKDRRLGEQSQRLNELGAEKDAAIARSAACEATIEVLNKQIDGMPKYEDVIAFGTEQMKQVNIAAAGRQEEFVKVVIGELKTHDDHVQAIHEESEKRAIERHELQTEINHSILKALSRIMQDVRRSP